MVLLTLMVFSTLLYLFTPWLMTWWTFLEGEEDFDEVIF
jgi:hypothetical protein